MTFKRIIYAYICIVISNSCKPYDSVGLLKKNSIEYIRLNLRCQLQTKIFEEGLNINHEELCEIFESDLKQKQIVLLTYQGRFDEGIFRKQSGYYVFLNSDLEPIGKIEHFTIDDIGFYEEDNYKELQNNKKFKLSRLIIRAANLNNFDNSQNFQISILLRP